jgi:NTE family protein
MRTIEVPKEDQCELLLAALDRFLGGFSKAHLASMLPSVHWLEYAAGELVMEEGTRATDVFFVVSGRLRAERRTARDGVVQVFGEMGRGEAVGEIAFLTGSPRTATVIAVRQSILVRLSRTAFDHLLADHPAVSIRLAGLIVERLHRANVGPSRRTRPTSIALVSLSRSLAIDAIATELARHLDCAPGEVGVVTEHAFRQKFRQKLEKDARADASGLEFAVARWLDDLEVAHSYLVLAVDGTTGRWPRCCIRQADEVLLFIDTEADAALPLGETERACSPTTCLATRRLVLVHSRNVALPRHSADWIARTRATDHVHVRKGSVADIARLGRIVSRSAVGLVLSGGGARGFAHVGVYKALCEHRAPLDFVAGTSMGAVVAAMIALEMSVDEALDACRRIFSRKLALDLNWLPAVSLLSGRRVRSGLARLFSTVDGAAIDIEDAWRNFFCIASSYSHAREVVLRHGPLEKLVRASLSMPVFLPPVVHDGEVLVDGGLMNNLPTDEMARCEVRCIIAVDLFRRRFGQAEARPSPGTSGLAAAPADSSRNGGGAVPRLFDVLYNAPTLSSAARQMHCARSADILIQPDLGSMGTLEWSAIDRAVNAGYIEARSKLADRFGVA